MADECTRRERRRRRSRRRKGLETKGGKNDKTMDGDNKVA